MGLKRLASYMKGKEDKIAVLVSTLTDDERLINVPKLRVCALHVTRAAKERIEKAGGEVLTFDELALKAPTGTNTVLLRGRRSARVANKYFGVPGAHGSSVRPHVRSKGRKFERARGRRNNCGYRI